MQTGRPLAAARVPVSQCPVCGVRRLSYAFSYQSNRVMQCADCGLMFLNPQPSEEELAKVYSSSYFVGHESDEGRRAASELKRATARQYLAELARYRGSAGGRLLEVGCGEGDFLAEAEAAGFDVVGVEYSATACAAARAHLTRGRVEHGQLEDAGLPDAHFDVCVLNDVVAHVRDPLRLFREIHRVLRPAGVLFIATPSLDSWSARVMKERWVEWKQEHLTYFNKRNVQTALLKTGFQHVLVRPGRKVLNLDYVRAFIDRVPPSTITFVLRTLGALLPSSARRAKTNVVATGMIVFSQKGVERERPKLSIVVPAFNEAATFDRLMSGLVAKAIPGLDIEVIVVESNSTDGTREIARKYADSPRVRLLLEDRPSGKGHAVRTGLAAATGDFVLIQDADLEYDMEDYEALLEPLIAGREAFVLGARHGGRKNWKMRQFTGKRGLSMFLNFGHWIFTTMINVLFLQRFRDPFTMYKVFRRDCLYGLRFECDRFDFDFELLIKLVRKGYKPLEIPVNYRSRSFAEGKKVSMFADPVSWLKALIWLRFTSCDPMAEIERQRRVGATRVAESAVARQ